jgi:hypothetical protein
MRWLGELLPKGLVLVFSCPTLIWWLWNHGLTRSCGKSLQPLQGVKTNRLAVSPVMGIYEQHIHWIVEDLYHSNFIIKFVGLTWEL